MLVSKINYIVISVFGVVVVGLLMSNLVMLI